MQRKSYKKDLQHYRNVRDMMTGKVLVLDGGLKTMPTVIRSLARYRLRVIVISNGKTCGYFSKYCWKRFDFSEFPTYIKFDAIGKIIEMEEVDAVFAHLESTIFGIYNIIDRISANVKVISPPRDVLEFAMNKYKVLKFAEKIGVKVPNTEIVTSDDLNTKDLNYPIFAKTLKEVDVPPGPGNRYIFVKDKSDLPRLGEFVRRHKRVMVQEYIEGFGCGIGGLFYNGKPVAVGGHRRIREAFKTGGPSTFAMSYINKKALKYALKLMKELRYSGFGMVEFKVTKTGEPYLMEINPRIWGTFPLYVKSGLNLPVLAYKLFVENDKSVLDRNYLDGFREGVKLIYLFNDIKSVVNQYTNKIQRFKEITKDILYLLFDPHTKEGFFEWKDPKPFIYLILSIVAKKFNLI